MATYTMHDAKKEDTLDVKAGSDHDLGTIEPLEDKANREFYGDSISESYRLKSELVANCMTEIGMGRYQ